MKAREEKQQKLSRAFNKPGDSLDHTGNGVRPNADTLPSEPRPEDPVEFKNLSEETINKLTSGDAGPIVRRRTADGFVEDPSARADVLEALAYLSSDKESAQMIDKFVNRSGATEIVVSETDYNPRWDPDTDTLYWNPTMAIITENGGLMSPAMTLGHEIAHVIDPVAQSFIGDIPMWDYDYYAEYRAISSWERPAAIRLGEGVRYEHRISDYYYVSCPTCK